MTRYPGQLVIWLADNILATGQTPTLLEMLDLDERYPGLMDDVALLLNVYHTIRKELKQDETGDG